MKMEPEIVLENTHFIGMYFHFSLSLIHFFDSIYFTFATARKFVKHLMPIEKFFFLFNELALMHAFLLPQYFVFFLLYFVFDFPKNEIKMDF
jgi:hypothetical protein